MIAWLDLAMSSFKLFGVSQFSSQTLAENFLCGKREDRVPPEGICWHENLMRKDQESLGLLRTRFSLHVGFLVRFLENIG